MEWNEMERSGIEWNGIYFSNYSILIDIYSKAF